MEVERELGHIYVNPVADIVAAAPRKLIVIFMLILREAELENVWSGFEKASVHAVVRLWMKTFQFCCSVIQLHFVSGNASLERILR